MDYEASMHDVLERLLHDESAEPRELPPSLLREITHNFDDSRIIGNDGFYTVYKGVLRNGAVAVKRMIQNIDATDDRFRNEVRCLMRVKHKNIVRFLAYCSDTQEEVLGYEGRIIFAEVRQRLLCFEYLRGGKLVPYIRDAFLGLGWRESYKIIKGICEGIHYLHQNLTVQLDLKPDNIWLDGKNVPKIHDFGGSMRLEEKQSEVIAEECLGTLGYIAPEYLSQSRLITLKADIYSLGVLITEILTGERGHSVVGNILESWAQRLGTSLEDTRLQQVRVCAEIGKSCLEYDRDKRPDAANIIRMLVETESTDEFAEPDETESMDEFTSDDEQFLVQDNTPAQNTTLTVQLPIGGLLIGLSRAMRSNLHLIVSLTIAMCVFLWSKLCSPSHSLRIGGASTAVDSEASWSQPTREQQPCPTDRPRPLAASCAASKTMELNILERVVSGSEGPRHLDLSLLQSITDNFSEQRKIGNGGCGEVYKGILRNGVVA